MRKLLLSLLFMAGTVNAASSVKEICTDESPNDFGKNH